jgi:hypothetical protein
MRSHTSLFAYLYKDIGSRKVSWPLHEFQSNAFGILATSDSAHTANKICRTHIGHYALCKLRKLIKRIRSVEIETARK